MSSSRGQTVRLAFVTILLVLVGPLKSGIIWFGTTGEPAPI
jgi:hypothetical protein